MAALRSHRRHRGPNGTTLNGDQAELPKFTPSSVKLLPNGHFLITNSWTGKTSLFQSGRFVGEVFEVNPNMVLTTQLNLVDMDLTTPTLFYAGGTGTGVYNNTFFRLLRAAPVRWDNRRCDSPDSERSDHGQPGQYQRAGTTTFQRPSVK